MTSVVQKYLQWALFIIGVSLIGATYGDVSSSTKAYLIFAGVICMFNLVRWMKINSQTGVLRIGSGLVCIWAVSRWFF